MKERPLLSEDLLENNTKFSNVLAYDQQNPSNYRTCFKSEGWHFSDHGQIFK